MIERITDANEKKVIARKVLEALTEWFEVLTKAYPPRSRNNGADLSNPEI